MTGGEITGDEIGRELRGERESVCVTVCERERYVCVKADATGLEGRPARC